MGPINFAKQNPIKHKNKINCDIFQLAAKIVVEAVGAAATRKMSTLTTCVIRHLTATLTFTSSFYTHLLHIKSSDALHAFSFPRQMLAPRCLSLAWR